MGPLYNEQFFNIVIFALMIAKGWSYRLDDVCVCWHASVRDVNAWHLAFFIIDAEGVSVGVYPDLL